MTGLPQTSFSFGLYHKNLLHNWVSAQKLNSDIKQKDEVRSRSCVHILHMHEYLCIVTAPQVTVSADSQPATPIALHCSVLATLQAFPRTHSLCTLTSVLLLLLAETSSTSASTCFDSALFMHPGGSLFLNWFPLEGLLAMLPACYFKRIFCFAAAGSICKSRIIPLPFDVTAPDRKKAWWGKFIHKSIHLPLIH